MVFVDVYYCKKEKMVFSTYYNFSFFIFIFHSSRFPVVTVVAVVGVKLSLDKNKYIILYILKFLFFSCQRLIEMKTKKTTK